VGRGGGERERQRQLALQPEEPGDGKGRQSADHVADGRRSGSREPGNRSLYGQCDESGKTDPQSRQPRPRRPRRLTPRPARCRSVRCCRCCLKRRLESDGPNASTRWCSRALAPVTPCVYASTPSIVAVHAVHLPVDEESLALSVRLHSRQLMSHRPQRCTAYLLRISLALPPSYASRPFAKVD